MLYVSEIQMGTGIRTLEQFRTMRDEPAPHYSREFAKKLKLKLQCQPSPVASKPFNKYID